MKKPLKLSYCSSSSEQKACVGWVLKYFSDCLCSKKDWISFVFGIASLICWGVAEIPQIITNFKNKSSDGVSLAFIFTWIVGDMFNLVGCILEPATLPTQFYTAVLYTTTTVILALECLYYDHFIPWWKGRKVSSNEAIDERNLLVPKQLPTGAESNAPIEVPCHRDFYFRSARSLAGSDTPNQSYMRPKSGPPTLKCHSDSSSSSSEDEDDAPARNRPVLSRPISVGYGTFLATSAYLPPATGASNLKLFGRRSLENSSEIHGQAYGQWLGWLMAAIYMGGRIPQIWLNIKRGSVEGLNPLMFIFALIANATYVGSILVRSTEWEKIKANMPWLLDAVVCVGLDLFIILQYVYYRFMRRKKRQSHGGYCGDYREANKPITTTS